MSRAQSGNPKRNASSWPELREPRRNPAKETMDVMAKEMLEVLRKPVLVAEDHAERLTALMLDAEQRRDFAILDRHARQLGALADRLLDQANHEAPHADVEPDDAAIREVLGALLADPTLEHS